jgi:CBS domain-containing protein|uniref:CBS domain-containing protein n=1 Tax=Desulfobacca acetoxidans TaxID=60893 RepID=A0A7V6A3X2_9BACT
MPVIDQKNVLKGLTVAEAMRRQVIAVDTGAPLEKVIRFTIKYKVNAILVTDEQQQAQGVVTKTDLMGAYYAGLPLETPAATIMVGPPLFCRQEDSLDAALNTMRSQRIHRLYVHGEDPGRAEGVLAYPDIVGLLYRFCRRCDRSILKKTGGQTEGEFAGHLTVREVMTPGVESIPEVKSLVTVMEKLAANRLAAVLVLEAGGRASGVISKTDLILAYKHGLPLQTPARQIMSTPVRGCHQDDFLAEAIEEMIFWDIHRLFVAQGEPSRIVGVLSLSDAARFRSGTCRACLVSRIAV